MTNIPKESIALNILRTYNGSNDYLIELRDILLKKQRLPITINMADYVIRNHNKKPVELNKKYTLHTSARKFIKEQYELQFVPEHIFINKLLSRTGDRLHIWGCFDENCKFFFSIYVNKTVIKKHKTVDLPSFEQYDRQPKPHQLTAIKALLENDKFILADDMGLGKCIIKNCNIYTPTGKKEIGSLVIGDKVIGSDGNPYNVTGVFPQGVKDLYQITFNDGYTIKCCKEHLWTVSSNNSGENSKNRENLYITLSVEQMLDKNLVLTQKGVGHNINKVYEFNTYYKVKNGDAKWQIPIVKPIQFQNYHTLPIEPYLLGICLGDGHIKKSSVRIELHKNDFDEIFTNVDLNESKPIDNKRCCYINFGDKLNNLNLSESRSDTKFIPDIYKYTSIENRLSILQGLMDTNGHCMKSKNGNFTGTEYATVSEQLANDVAEIVHSLGGIVRKKSKIGSYKKEDGTKVICKKCYRLNIKLPDGMNPFRLKRKANAYNPPKKYKVGRYIKDIKPCGEGEAVCISVDSPDKLYVTEHAIVTHNTTSAILAALAGKYQRILIVTTATLKLNWKKEIELFESSKDISIVEGSDFTCKKWTIINYDILKNFHFLKEKGQKDEDVPKSVIDFYNFDLVIADEAHYLKNATSNRTKIFNDFAMKIPTRWLLTGTPITNKPIDIYNLLYICESPLTDNWVHFVRRYCDGKQFYRKGTKQKYWVTAGASNLEELNEFISDIYLRRLKKDAIDLPEKIIKEIYLPLEHSRRYNEYLEEYKRWSDEMLENEVEHKPSEHLTQLVKVRQLLSEDKASHTISLAEDFIENGHKVIIFSCFTNTLNEIHEHFGKAKSVMIDGSVSSKNRDIAVERFQKDDKIKVFCGNIVAAGAGITLTEGTIVIFNDLDWVPANHSQATDRAYRIGQTKDVYIIYTLIDNTLDIVMFKKLQEKMKNIEIALGDNSTFDKDVSILNEVIKSIKD